MTYRPKLAKVARLFIAATLCAAGCGSTETDTARSDVALILIEALTFFPAELVVNPGDTVAVQNNDHRYHSVTSAAAPGSYVPEGVEDVRFDTGLFDTGVRSFVVPEDVVSGTVIYYFCSVYKNSMANSGHLLIR